MPTISVDIPLYDEPLRGNNSINYRLYDPADNREYEHVVNLSPQEAFMIGIKLVEAAIPLLAEEELNDLKRKDK